jgi:hypothetical protein
MSQFKPSVTRPDAVPAVGRDDATRPAAPSATSPAGRVVLALDDLLWFKSSEDDEGRITLGVLACSRESIGVLVDDNGESLGLRLTRTEVQDLNRTLVAWLAATARSAAQ